MADDAPPPDPLELFRRLWGPLGVPLPGLAVPTFDPQEVEKRIASRFIHELPRTVRFVLRPTGALNRSGSNLASYLLFEEPFCRALVDLGYQDTVAREAEVRQFFAEEPAHG